MLNVLITGAGGQLGQEIQALAHNFSEFHFIWSYRQDLDISNLDNIRSFIKDKKIDAIVNCAAYTAVDNAEKEEEQAFCVNAQGVRNLAIAANEIKAKLIHISTDYVFDGKTYQPYSSDIQTNPLGVYGKSKLAGEKAILELSPKNCAIIRVSWLYGFYAKNFVKTMLKLSKERDEINVVYDQIGSPTYAKDLAETVLTILPKLENNQPEIYHYANSGVASWFDLAKTALKLVDYQGKVNPIPSSVYPTLATRPNYSVLDTRKIQKDFNLTIPYWQDSLEHCIRRLAK